MGLIDSELYAVRHIPSSIHCLSEAKMLKSSLLPKARRKPGHQPGFGQDRTAQVARRSVRQPPGEWLRRVYPTLLNHLRFSGYCDAVAAMVAAGAGVCGGSSGLIAAAASFIAWSGVFWPLSAC